MVLRVPLLTWVIENLQLVKNYQIKTHLPKDSIVYSAIKKQGLP
jgi:hypothetical protein